VVVGGYRFDSNQNVQQKNYPTSGIVSGGASVETSVRANLRKDGQDLVFVLNEPDFTTAERIADGINASLGSAVAEVRGADQVATRAPASDAELYRLVSKIENVEVSPQALARVVINERSGTIVAGGETQISSVVISQGDIKVSVSTDNQAPQPLTSGYGRVGRSLVITNTKLDVSESDRDVVVRFPSTTVADLVEGLQRVHVDTRGVINVLQAMKTAGSLHAQIIVQ
jgi:flagellar P-ring protein precursor FlgI